MATAQYEKHDWTDGETITEENLDHIEQGVAAATDGLRALEEQAFTSIQVETLAAGSPATAVVQDGVLKLGLPQGATGPTGADGADGAQGSPGRQVSKALPTASRRKPSRLPKQTARPALSRQRLRFFRSSSVI